MKCQGAKCVTHLDLTSSFWQIPLHKESRKYSVLMLKNKCYQFRAVPFSLVTSLAAIIKCLELVLGPDMEEFISIFINDILVTSKSLDEHIKHLRKVFEKLQKVSFV